MGRLIVIYYTASKPATQQRGNNSAPLINGRPSIGTSGAPSIRPQRAAGHAPRVGIAAVICRRHAPIKSARAYRSAKGPPKPCLRGIAPDIARADFLIRLSRPITSTAYRLIHVGRDSFSHYAMPAKDARSPPLEKRCHIGPSRRCGDFLYRRPHSIASSGYICRRAVECRQEARRA